MLFKQTNRTHEELKEGPMSLSWKTCPVTKSESGDQPSPFVLPALAACYALSPGPGIVTARQLTV